MFASCSACQSEPSSDFYLSRCEGTGGLMNMQLLFKIGEMIERSQQTTGVDVDSDEAKIKIGNFVQEIADGRSGKDLSAEGNVAWGEMGRRLHGADRLPAHI